MSELIFSELSIDKKKKLVAFDRLGKGAILGKIECARNIYLMDNASSIIWQIKSDFDDEGNPFTNITQDPEGNFWAYRWDGGRYRINMETGFARPDILLK